jgi:U3 small nucleolar RNA-associated protein 7
MESLITQGNAIGPPKGGKTQPKSSRKAATNASDSHDPTLTSIAAKARIPKSLSNAEEGDSAEKKRKAKKGKYGYVTDLKLRAHLHRMEEGKKDWKEAMEDVQMLNVGTQGAMEAEGDLERTWKTTQDDIVTNVGLDDAKARMEWKLDGGSYQCKFTRSGRKAFRLLNIF